MDSGPITDMELRQQLQLIQTLSFRMMLRRIGNEWYLHTLFLDTFPNLDDWHHDSFSYNYGALHFIAGQTSGATLVDWLADRVGELYLDGDLKRTFQLPLIQAHLIWRHQPSHHYADFGPYPRPYTKYELHSRYSDDVDSALQNLDTGFLLASDCAFFPTARAAILNLMYRIPDWEQNSGLSISPSIVLRVAKQEAWLGEIVLSPTSVHVNVYGNKVPGTRLIVTRQGNPIYDETLTTRKTVRCLLPDGIPTPLWVVLSRGSEWIDYYERDTRYPMLTRPPSNVAYDPGDMASELEALIVQGEGPEIEFKREISNEGERIKRTVSAFANTSGGTIIIGVTNDPVEVVGIVTSTGKLKDDLMRMIRANVVPMPAVTMVDAKINGKPVVAMRVEMTSEHACGVQPSDPHYYVRRGANNFPAKPEEITHIIQARQRQIAALPLSDRLY